eukprot:12339937-Heterocapsa_arctica.AAC.1
MGPSSTASRTGRTSSHGTWPRCTRTLLLPGLTSQMAVSGIGEWNYAEFMTHHIHAMTEYLIKEGHGDSSLGPAGVITHDSFNIHFKRTPGNTG